MTIQTLFGPEEIPTKQRCMIAHRPLSLFIKDKGGPPESFQHSVRRMCSQPFLCRLCRLHQSV